MDGSHGHDEALLATTALSHVELALGVAVGTTTLHTSGLAGCAGGVLGEAGELLIVAAGVGEVLGVDLGGDGGGGGGEGAGHGGGEVVQDVAAGDGGFVWLLSVRSRGG